MEKLLKQVQEIFPDAEKSNVMTNVIVIDEFQLTVSPVYELSTEQEHECNTCFCDTYTDLTICSSKDFNKILKVLQAIADCNN